MTTLLNCMTRSDLDAEHAMNFAFLIC